VLDAGSASTGSGGAAIVQRPVSDFDVADYWEPRLSGHFSLEGVGWLGLGGPFNEWMYRVRRRAFRRYARRYLRGDRLDVLDIGSGTGYYLALWREVGATTVTGSDLTGVSVERLEARYPDMRIVQLDIGGDLTPLDGARFDAISIMDVLYHVVDDNAYERAIANLSDLLKAGGLLFATENLVHGDAVRGENQVSRSISQIGRLLRRSGLEIVERRPVFALMNTPVDSNSRVLRRWWDELGVWIRRGPRIASFLGAVLYPLEIAITSVIREGPSTELLICRKSGGPAGNGVVPRARICA
jgi:SAM-dependent methyltransferase